MANRAELVFLPGGFEMATGHQRMGDHGIIGVPFQMEVIVNLPVEPQSRQPGIMGGRVIQRVVSAERAEQKSPSAILRSLSP